MRETRCPEGCERVGGAGATKEGATKDWSEGVAPRIFLSRSRAAVWRGCVWPSVWPPVPRMGACELLGEGAGGAAWHRDEVAVLRASVAQLVWPVALRVEEPAPGLGLGLPRERRQRPKHNPVAQGEPGAPHASRPHSSNRARRAALDEMFFLRDVCKPLRTLCF